MRGMSAMNRMNLLGKTWWGWEPSRLGPSGKAAPGNGMLRQKK